VEIPAAGGIGSARAIASCFGKPATGAKTLRLGGRTLDELTAPGVPPVDGWSDVVWHTDIRFSAVSSSPARPAGSGPAAARSAPRAPAAHSASPTLISASTTPTRPTAWVSTSSTILASTPSAPPSTAAFVPHKQRQSDIQRGADHERASRNPVVVRLERASQATLAVPSVGTLEVVLVDAVGIDASQMLWIWLV
jgi:hypothetical protein